MKTKNNLPIFSDINPESIPENLEQHLDDNRQRIEKLLADNTSYNWTNLMQPIEAMDDKLHHFWSPIAHMHAVVNSEAIRNAYQQCLPKLSAYYTEIGQNEKLYQAVQAIVDSPQYKKLSRAQQKILENDLRDFRLAGVNLEQRAKERFKQLQQQLTELSNSFEQNLLDATNAWTYHIEQETQLSGVPEHAITAAKEAAKAKDLDGYLLTLEMPCYHAIISYADDSALRERIYTAYMTRASDQGPNGGKWDNSTVMDDILAIRHELAKLIGFQHYPEMSLVTKMAKDPEQVLEFLHDLVARAKPQAEAEFKELQDYAKEHHDIDQLNTWDVAYYSEKLRQHRYDISQEELRPYFPEDVVINGMFDILQRIYGIRFKERQDVDTWHKDVRFFEILDEQGDLRGQIYMDLYARSDKRGGAWMDECIIRRRKEDSTLQTPVAYLTCNFAGPSADRPALFSHQEVITLFHECGHCLHHLLTKIDYAGVSGINGVPWDAVGPVVRGIIC